MSVCLYAYECPAHKGEVCEFCKKLGHQHNGTLFYYSGEEVVCKFCVEVDQKERESNAALTGERTEGK